MKQANWGLECNAFTNGIARQLQLQEWRSTKVKHCIKSKSSESEIAKPIYFELPYNLSLTIFIDTLYFAPVYFKMIAKSPILQHCDNKWLSI